MEGGEPATEPDGEHPECEGEREAHEEEEDDRHPDAEEQHEQLAEADAGAAGERAPKVRVEQA